MGHVTTLVRTEPKEARYWPDYADNTLKSNGTILSAMECNFFFFTDLYWACICINAKWYKCKERAFRLIRVQYIGM